MGRCFRAADRQSTPAPTGRKGNATGRAARLRRPGAGPAWRGGADPAPAGLAPVGCLGCRVAGYRPPVDHPTLTPARMEDRGLSTPDQLMVPGNTFCLTA